MEILRLYYPDKPGEHLIKVSSVTSFESGEGAARVNGTLISGSSETEISLITKTTALLYSPVELTTENRLNYPPSKLFYMIWEGLKESNLPVVDDLWLVSDFKVAMTDLTPKGGTAYDRNTLFDLMVNRRRHTELDSVFLAMNTEKVGYAARGIVNKATSLGIGISLDDPMSLIIQPNGDWKVVLLDIGLTRFGFSSARESNEMCLEKFTQTLKGVKRGIQYYLDS